MVSEHCMPVVFCGREEGATHRIKSPTQAYRQDAYDTSLQAV